MRKRLSYWLLVTAVISLGFGQLLRFEFSGIPILITDLVITLILLLNAQATVRVFAAQVILPFRSLSSLFKSGISIFFLGISMGWIIAFLIFPIAKLMIPILYALRLLAYILVFLFIYNQKILIPKIYYLLSGIILTIIGYLQYFLLPDMRNFFYLGWDDHLNRLVMPHFDPTFTAVMLGMYLLSIFPTKSTISYALTVLAIPALMLTYSRSVWLSFIIALTFTLKDFRKILAVVLVFIALLLFLPQRFGEGNNLLRTFSISSRLSSDWSLVQKFGVGLLTGHGFNTLALAPSSNSYPDHANSPNNSYLYLLATTGFLGLFGWCKFLRQIYIKSTHKPLLIFFFICSLFNNVMFYPFALLWILLLESQSQQLKLKNKN